MGVGMHRDLELRRDLVNSERPVCANWWRRRGVGPGREWDPRESDSGLRLGDVEAAEFLSRCLVARLRRGAPSRLDRPPMLASGHSDLDASPTPLTGSPLAMEIVGAPARPLQEVPLRQNRFARLGALPRVRPLPPEASFLASGRGVPGVRLFAPAGRATVARGAVASASPWKVPHPKPPAALARCPAQGLCTPVDPSP
jgi:hypothetical protein